MMCFFFINSRNIYSFIYIYIRLYILVIARRLAHSSGFFSKAKLSYVQCTVNLLAVWISLPPVVSPSVIVMFISPEF